MIEVIEDILKAEADAEQALIEARETAKRMLSQNGLVIDRMYNDAAASLREEVEQLLQDAEIESTALEQAYAQRANDRIQQMINAARQSFDNALKLVEDIIWETKAEEDKGAD